MEPFLKSVQDLTDQINVKEAIWEQQDYSPVELKELINFMSQIKGALAMVSSAKSVLEKTHDLLRKNIVPNRMQEKDIKSITIDGIGKVTLTSDMYANIPAANKEAAHQWLGDNGHQDMVRPTVNAASLKALAKEMILRSTPLPEDIFNVTPYSRASIKKQ